MHVGNEHLSTCRLPRSSCRARYEVARAVCRAPVSVRSECTSFLMHITIGRTEYMFQQAYPPKDRSQAPLFGRCGYTGQQPALRKICKREGVVLGIHLLAIRCNRLVSHASHASGLCSHVTGSITCADQPQLLAVLLHKLPQSDGCTAADACGTPSGWESHTG